MSLIIADKFPYLKSVFGIIIEFAFRSLKLGFGLIIADGFPSLQSVFGLLIVF